MPEEGLEARVRELELKDAADRERLLGLLERSERELFPLVEMYGRMDERFNIVLRDLKAAHSAIRQLELDAEKARDDHSAEVARVEKQAAVSAQDAQARADQQRIENRRMVYGLLGIFITAASTVLIAILTGGGHP